MNTITRLAIPLIAASLVGACAVAPRAEPGWAPVGQAPVAGAPVAGAQGTITGIEMAQGQGTALTPGGGAVLGGIAGAIIGRGISSDATTGYRQRNIATAVGAVLGAVVGNQIERESRSSASYRVTVALDRGGSVTLQQREIGDLRVGDRVRVEQDRAVRG